MGLDASIALFFIFSLFVFIFLIAFVIRYRNRIREHHRLKIQFSQALLQSQLEIKEQTLNHISRELHDNLGQVASLIKINLFTIKLSDTQKAEEKIEQSKELIRQLLVDLKTLSVNLGSDRVNEMGLVKALESEATRLNKTGVFHAVFSNPGHIPVMDAGKAIILFRMYQEVLNNIVKHSGAKHIKIVITSNEKFITLAVSDDGIGFNVTEQINSGGAGLLNLQNRAKLINAYLTIQSAPGNGTQVIIQFPL